MSLVIPDVAALLEIERYPKFRYAKEPSISRPRTGRTTASSSAPATLALPALIGRKQGAGKAELAHIETVIKISLYWLRKPATLTRRRRSNHSLLAPISYAIMVSGLCGRAWSGTK